MEAIQGGGQGPEEERAIGKGRMTEKLTDEKEGDRDRTETRLFLVCFTGVALQGGGRDDRPQ